MELFPIKSICRVNRTESTWRVSGWSSRLFAFIRDDQSEGVFNKLCHVHCQVHTAYMCTIHSTILCSGQCTFLSHHHRIHSHMHCFALSQVQCALPHTQHLKILALPSNRVLFVLCLRTTTTVTTVPFIGPSAKTFSGSLSGSYIPLFVCSLQQLGEVSVPRSE